MLMITLFSDQELISQIGYTRLVLVVDHRSSTWYNPERSYCREGRSYCVRRTVRYV